MYLFIIAIIITIITIITITIIIIIIIIIIIVVIIFVTIIITMIFFNKKQILVFRLSGTRLLCHNNRCDNYMTPHR
jgi:hypothetical protein